MILRTKDDELDKPIEREMETREDYRIPEPQDIRRMPVGFQEPPRSLGRREYEREPLERPLPRPAPMERYGRSLEDTINEILYRLDEIERRLARIEGYEPQPRRY